MKSKNLVVSSPCDTEPYNTVESHLMATPLIQRPCYYGNLYSCPKIAQSAIFLLKVYTTDFFICSIKSSQCTDKNSKKDFDYSNFPSLCFDEPKASNVTLSKQKKSVIHTLKSPFNMPRFLWPISDWIIHYILFHNVLKDKKGAGH